MRICSKLYSEQHWSQGWAMGAKRSPSGHMTTWESECWHLAALWHLSGSTLEATTVSDVLEREDSIPSHAHARTHAHSSRALLSSFSHHYQSGRDQRKKKPMLCIRNNTVTKYLKPPSLPVPLRQAVQTCVQGLEGLLTHCQCADAGLPVQIRCIQRSPRQSCLCLGHLVWHGRHGRCAASPCCFGWSSTLSRFGEILNLFFSGRPIFCSRLGDHEQPIFWNM